MRFYIFAILLFRSVARHEQFSTMGVTALSVPSIIMLKQVMKNKLLGIFVGIISLGIIFIGYVFNIFQFLII